MTLDQLFVVFASLLGTGGLIGAIVNALKTVGAVTDGQAPQWSLGLNVAGLVALFLIGVVAPTTDIKALDGVAGEVAKLLTIAVGLFVQLGGAKIAHGLLKGVPVIGKSFSAKPPAA